MVEKLGLVIYFFCTAMQQRLDFCFQMVAIQHTNQQSHLLKLHFPIGKYRLKISPNPDFFGSNRESMFSTPYLPPCAFFLALELVVSIPIFQSQSQTFLKGYEFDTNTYPLRKVKDHDRNIGMETTSSNAVKNAHGGREGEGNIDNHQRGSLFTTKLRNFLNNLIFNQLLLIMYTLLCVKIWQKILMFKQIRAVLVNFLFYKEPEHFTGLLQKLS